MANASPYKARLGKKLRGKPGDLPQVQLILWYALKRAQGILEDTDDEEPALRAIHAVSQVAGQYVKLLEVGEFEARLKALEDANLNLRRNGH
jgi:hypothetical protein